MKRERIVEFVGGSDEEVAHLRLLLRKAAGMLMDRWSLRREGDPTADLLVIDPQGIVGSTALEAARESGRRHVRMLDAEAPTTGADAMLRPLSLDKITRMFNLASIAAELPPAQLAAPTAAVTENVFDDMFADAAQAGWQPRDENLAELPNRDFDRRPVVVAQPPPSPVPVDQQRNQLRASYKDALKGLRLPDDAAIEATEGLTELGGARRNRRGSFGSPSEGAHSLTPEQANRRLPLLEYLTGNLLSGPSRIEAGGVALTLDPRNQNFYARGALCIFEDFCLQDLRRGDWHGLSYGDFADVKEQQEARPYAQLHWLCIYLRNAPATRDRFSASARYTLGDCFELQRDYPRAARVARELAGGTTLAQAAAAARVPLAEAQRVAAAFSAIGLLQPG